MAIKKIETLNKHQNPATNENEFDIENYMNVNWDKIKEVVDNNADELTTTQGKMNTLQENVEEIKDNQIHVITEKSSNLNIKDASGQNAKINVFGVSKQETRSGKNKLKLTNQNYISAGLNWEATETEVKINGTATGTYSISNLFECDIKAGTYKFLAGGDSGFVYRIWLYNTANEMIKYTTSGEQFTITEDIVKYQLVFDNITVGNTYNTTFKPMILEATEQDETFEQYGASPSPDFPSEIENTGGNIDITDCNKNLFDFNDLENTNIITVNEDGSITLANNTNSAGYTNTGKRLKELCRGLKVGDVAYLKLITTFSNEGIYLQGSNSYSWTNGYSKTITEDMLEDVVVFYGGYQKTDTIQIQITRNSLEDYEMHEQQLITFPLAEGQKLMEGDYLADDGIHHKRTQVEIKGMETQWIYYSANDIWARPYLTFTNKKIGESNNTANALCNKAKSISWEEMCQNIDGVSVFTYEGDNRISITIKKEDLETQDVEGVKKYFQKNNMIVEYNLAEEEVEPYTEEQQTAYNQLQNAKTYKTVTNVFTENAELEMEYIADTKTYIDNKVNNMQNQLNTINELLSTTNTSALLLDNMQTDLESEVL